MGENEEQVEINNWQMNNHGTKETRTNTGKYKLKQKPNVKFFFPLGQDQGHFYL